MRQKVNSIFLKFSDKMPRKTTIGRYHIYIKII